MSDKYLTEQCGLLDYLLPGDEILADRGFNVQESVGIYCAEIKVPACTRGKNNSLQLKSRAQTVPRVRIHVERVIGVLRQKYTIFQSILPISSIMRDSATELSFIDKAVVVCSALCTCCESAAPFCCLTQQVMLILYAH